MKQTIVVNLTKTDIREIIAEKFKVGISCVELLVSHDNQYGDTFIDAEVTLPDKYDLSAIYNKVAE